MLFFSDDRERLAQAEASQFIQQCQAEFKEQPLAIANRRKVQLLSAASYLPNFLSASTAAFAVIYLLSGYRWQIAAFLGFLLLAVILAVEVAKRLLISSQAKEFFVWGKVNALPVVALLACFGLSMTASYIGGKQLVVETASPPPRIVSPEADSLRQLLAAQESTIARLQKTTWRGKVTRKAQAGIREAKTLQNQLYSRIATLEVQADSEHREALGKHQRKHLNFGYLLGALAALADLALLALLWNAKKLRFQVAVVHQPAQAPLPHHQGKGYQIPHLGNSQPDPNLNRTARRIGFFNRPEPNEPAPRQRAEPEAGPEQAEPESPNATVINGTVTPDLQPGEKVCLNCEGVYRYKVNWQKFCCPKCKAEYHARKHGGEPFRPKKYHRIKNRTA